MNIHPTPYQTFRLNIKHEEFPQNDYNMVSAKERKQRLIAALNALCVWGGYDKRDADLISWEFHNDFPKSILRQLLSRMGANMESLEELG